jgi:transposase
VVLKVLKVHLVAKAHKVLKVLLVVKDHKVSKVFRAPKARRDLKAQLALKALKAHRFTGLRWFSGCYRFARFSGCW